MFPLIKGYDDYDKVLRELLGDTAPPILAASRSETPESVSIGSMKVGSEKAMTI